METAGEGGPYGMALLCAYMLWCEDGETLADYLENKVFVGMKSLTVMADSESIEGCSAFVERYKNAFPLERLATEIV